MASCGNPAVEPDALMPRRAKYDKTRECWKCRTSTGNVIIRHAVYCKVCFFSTITHKFRRILDPFINVTKSRKAGLKPAGNLCLGFSGGLGSSTLLDMVSQLYFAPGPEDSKGGTQHPRRAGAWKRVTVCYVDISNALPGAKDRTEEVRGFVTRYPEYEFVPLRIEDAFDDSWWTRVGGAPLRSHIMADLTDEELFLSRQKGTSPLESLRGYLSALPTQTAVPTAIHNLIRLLLLHTAWAADCSHLLLGTSLTSLSISLISSISQGGGYVVRDEAQEEWQPHVNVEPKRTLRVNRPLRDVGMKECGLWAWWKDLPVVGKESVFSSKQGVGSLTRAFIVGLERDYPSTVSTIVRTCAKLAPKDATAEDVTCVLCDRPAQSGVQDWKSRISIRSFAELSPDLWPSHYNSALSIPPSSNKNSKPALTPHLCYACHTTLTSRSSRGSTVISHEAQSTPLPVWMGPRLEEKSRRLNAGQMKEAISEFLLSDDEA